MPKFKVWGMQRIAISQIMIAILLGLGKVPSAQANCVDTVSDLPDVQPAMQRHWQKLQQQTSYPWGKARPYGQLSDNQITLTPDFDRLTGPQKMQALELLRLGAWPVELLTKAEESAIQARNNGWIPGAMSPYQVYASDGRAISMPYDGCTRFTLLTESARYSWYYKGVDSPEIRNAGKPSWRQVRFPITAAAEKAVRLKFWNTMSYRYNGWIAWVPEHGYFEIEVRTDAATLDEHLRTLSQFWQVAPWQYRYVVVDQSGTILQKRNF